MNDDMSTQFIDQCSLQFSSKPFTEDVNVKKEKRNDTLLKRHEAKAQI